MSVIASLLSTSDLQQILESKGHGGGGHGRSSLTDFKQLLNAQAAAQATAVAQTAPKVRVLAKAKPQAKKDRRQDDTADEEKHEEESRQQSDLSRWA